MRVINWLKAHKLIVGAALALVLLWIFVWKKRVVGHRTPEEAIAEGWMVWQAGITGWKEESPDGKTSIYHDEGWTGSPFAYAG